MKLGPCQKYKKARYLTKFFESTTRAQLMEWGANSFISSYVLNCPISWVNRLPTKYLVKYCELVEQGRYTELCPILHEKKYPDTEERMRLGTLDLYPHYFGGKGVVKQPYKYIKKKDWEDPLINPNKKKKV